MNDMATAETITVSTYPARLSDDDISWLIHVAENKLRPEAPTFAHWLANVGHCEQDRRIIGRTCPDAAPIETTLPAFRAGRWSEGELADALIAIDKVCDLATGSERPAVADLVAEVRRLLIVWTAVRLKTKGNKQ